MRLEDSTFIVTGGGSGLGAATTRRLVAGGASVIIADVDDEGGSRIAQDVGHRVRFVHSDVADEAGAQAAVDAAVDAFGGVRGLVNCAGIATATRVVGRDGPQSLDEFVRVITVNLVGTFNMVRLAGAAMMDVDVDDGDERGVIVNTASIAAFEGQIGQAAYSASKGGVASMTLPIAREFAQHGIRVVTIAPGIFDTPMMGGLPEKARASLASQIPFPSRLGRPDEYAALVAHIVVNQMLNGEVIRLDGGIRMAPT